jgi:DNA-binding transcriptional regulator YhcF (GntR family)
LLKIGIDRTSRGPLYRKVYDALRCAIVDGSLPSGMRLPSTRSLAKRLGISRNTVLSAYELLVAEELLIGKIGSGTRVRDGSRIPTPKSFRPSTLLRQSALPGRRRQFRGSRRKSFVLPSLTASAGSATREAESQRVTESTAKTFISTC